MTPRENAVTSESGANGGQRGDVALADNVDLPWRWIAAALSGHEPTVSPNGVSAPDSIVDTSVWKHKWSGMRLVDTVVLNDTGQVESWIFTAKTGHMTSKKRSQDRTKVAERFERFALANPHNTEGYVAVTSNGQGGAKPGTRLALDKATLREMLIEPMVPPQELLGATLQCFLRPQNGLNSFLRGSYEGGPHQPSSWALTRVSPLYRLANGAGDTSIQTPVLDGVSDASRLKSETKRVLNSLVAFIEGRLPSQRRVRSCEAEFIVDDNGELWLTSLPSVTVTKIEADSIAESSTAVTSSIPAPSSPRTKKTSPSEGGHEHVGGPYTADCESSQCMLPLGTTTQTLAPVDGSESPLGSSRQGSIRSDARPSNTMSSTTSGNLPRQLDGDTIAPSSEGALPVISTMFGERSTPGDHNISTVGEQGQRLVEPIIERKSGVYMANMHASMLRGLCCWRECIGRKGSDSRGGSSPRWQLVEGRYKGNLVGEDRLGGDDAGALGHTSSPATFNQLSKARFKVTARSVLLAMAEASFLRGEEPLRSGGVDHWVTEQGDDATPVSLAQRWRLCDQRAQLSLASANPQAYYDEVTVCGNVMEICRKLDSIRMCGFPDGNSVAIGSPGNKAPLNEPPRPSSEPLPDSIPSITSWKDRPGTAAADSDNLGRVSGQEGSVVSRGSCTTATLVALHSGRLGTISTGTRRNLAGQAGSSDSTGFDNIHAHRDRKDVQVTKKEERVGNKKTGSTMRDKANTKVLDRISGVYRETAGKAGGGGVLKGKRRGGGAGRHRKARSMSDVVGNSSNTEDEKLPSVSALARFAIERERVAREIGVDELGDLATLGVVDVVGTHGNSYGQSGATKRATPVRGCSNGDSSAGAGGTHEGGSFSIEDALGREGRSAGEILLEKLESVAEARSIESAGPPDGFAEQTSHGDWTNLEASQLSGDEHGESAGEWSEQPPAGGELSITESAFLDRSRRHHGLEGSVSGLHGDSLFGGYFDAGFREGTGDGGDGSTIGGGGGIGGGGNLATISALRDRLATLEGENAALRARARRAEEERAAEAVRGEKAGKKLAKARTEFSRAMSEKDEDYQRKALALEERHSRELAKRSKTCADEISRQLSSGQKAGTGQEKGAALFDSEQSSSKNLVARLDQALKDMAEQQRRFADVKRTLLAEKAQEVASVEAKGRRELQEARSLIAATEDRASAFQEQISEAAKSISTLKAREDEQKKRRKTAEEDTDKVRKEINVLRQTVQASQSMDVTDESGGRRDGQSALAAVTVTSEARIRTLNNKVDFLKAQLASEQTLKAEVEAALAVSRKSLIDGKDEARKQAAVAENAREAAVEEAVTRVQRQVEESVSETYRVHSKVQALQDQLNDALGDLSTARRREEVLKTELAHTTTKLEHRGAELAKAQSRADDLAEARAADTETSADRAAREAVVRRLDNERQYLKNQLQSEITCRDELREALATATRHLGELKADWTEEQSSRTEKFQRELQKQTEALGDLNDEKVAMEAELVVATRQLGLLKEGYSKARDNLRAEQSALETARTANRRLREEVTACTEELVSLRAQHSEDAKRHSESLVAAKTALDEADESKRKQGVEQQLQLRHQLLKTGEVQRQLMTLQTQLAARERVSDRMLAAERLGEGLARWSKNRKAWAFYRTAGGATMSAAQDDVRERTRRTLREAGEGARRAQERAVEEARREAALKTDHALEEARRIASHERSMLLEDAEAAAAVAGTQLQTIDELKALEEATRRELEKTRAEAKESARKCRENGDRAAQEAGERAKKRLQDAVTSTKEMCEETSKRDMEEADERWRIVLREHLDKAGEEAAEAAAAASRDHDALLEETQHAFRMERERLREEAKLLALSTAAKERERSAEREAEARAAGAAEAAAAAATAAEDSRRASVEEREAALAAASERAAAKAAAATLLEEDTRKRKDEEAARAREKLEKELAAARERAVKLEGGKWRRASEEAEARAAAEQAAAYERGMVDRGRQAEAEAGQLQQAAEKALEEVKQGARRTIEEMSARHSEELEAEIKRVAEEGAAKRDRALEAAQEEWNQQQTKAVENARAIATVEARARAERERATAVEAARERERLATEKVQDELRNAKTEWATERRSLKEKSTLSEEAEQKAKDDLRRAMANSSQATQRARARWEEGQKVAMEKVAAHAVEDRDKALEDARRVFAREKKRAIMENQDAFHAQAEAMTERLRKQASASLKQAQALHEETEREKDRLAEELEHYRGVLKERETVAAQIQQDSKEQSVFHSIQIWRFATAAFRHRREYTKSFEQLRAEMNERESAMELATQEQKQAMSADIEELLQLAFESRRRFSEMQETLVNHKREVLIDHKVQSTSLHKELDSLARDRDQLEEQRLLLQREFRDLETQAKEIEKEAHAHSRQSAIGPDGTIIPARARKKRRLDEELEGQLEAMETKRGLLSALDGKLAALAESRSVKDEEMKALERTLVQVLVEQQKKLLAVLSEVAEQGDLLEEINKRTQFQRDEAKRRRAHAQRQRHELGGALG